MTNPEASLARDRRLRDIVRQARSRDRLDCREALFDDARDLVGLGAFKSGVFAKDPVTIAPGEMEIRGFPFRQFAAAEREKALTAPFEAV